MANRMSRHLWRPRIDMLESRDLLSYSVVDLGTLGGTTTMPADINEIGQVVGHSATPNGQSRAFLWDPVSGMHDLGSLAGGASRAEAINDLGQVVGWFTLSGAPQGAAFIWQRGEGMTALPPLNGVASSRANGINNLGQVVGFSKGAAFSDYKATLWEGGVPTDLGTVGTEPARAYDINDNGQVVGKVTNYADGPSVLWDNGSIVDIGALGPYGTFAVDINNQGQVTGSSPIVGPGNFFLVNRAFLYEVGGTIQNLGTLECRENTVAFAIGAGINDHGDVVGSHGCVVTFAHEKRVAAVWNAAEGWKDLNKLIPPNSGWELTQTTAINNHGQIVGIGYKASDIYPRGFLLNPAPTPAPSGTASATFAVLITADLQSED